MTNTSYIMRLITICLCAFIGCIGCIGMAIANAQESVSLGQWTFEEHGVNGWFDDFHVANIDTDVFHTGHASMRINFAGKEAAYVYTAFRFPVPQTPRARLMKYSFYVKTADLPKNRPAVWLLRFSEDGRSPEAYPGAISIPVSPEWTKVEGEAIVDNPDQRGFHIYIDGRGTGGQGTVWIDDVTIDLLDRGILFEGNWTLQGSTIRHIFVEDRAQLPLVISSAAQVLSGDVKVYDENKKLLFTTPIAAKTGRAMVDLPSRGFYELTASVRYRDGITSTATTTAAVVGPLIPDALRLKSPFGMSQEIGMYGDGEGVFIAAGVNWDRRFHSPGLDIYKQAAATGYAKPLPPQFTNYPTNLTSFYALFPQPTWLQDRSGADDSPSICALYPMKDKAAFEELIAYVMKSLSEKPIDYVEIANEPDWHGPTSGLVDYSRLFSQAVKKVSPQTKVVGPSYCDIQIYALEALKELGYFDFIDGVAIHAYSPPPPEGVFIERVRNLKKYLASIGKQHLPIYITEYGWSLPPGDQPYTVDQLTQTRYMSRSLTLLVAEQIDAIEPFCMWYGTPDTVGYQLLNFDRTPRSSFTAYANAARCLTGVSGPGRVLRLTPTTYLVLFRKGAETIAVAWDTEKQSSVILPRPCTTVRDMTGRPVAIGKSSTITVDPSPVFISCAKEWYDIHVTATNTVTQGSTLTLPWTPQWTPQPLKAKGRTLTVPRETPVGEYLVIGKTTAGWQALSLTVVAPLTVSASEMVWPGTDAQPSLQVKVVSPLPNPADATCQLQLDGGAPTATVAARIQANGETTVTIPLSKLKAGQRYRGQVIIRIPGTSISARHDVDLTPMPCEPLPVTADGAVEWTNIPITDRFTPCLQLPDVKAYPDFSAKMQVGYTDSGLHARIIAQDDDHQQTGHPMQMWSQDSVQLAFDMDADKPWGATADGMSGHQRVFEYGAALGKDGPVSWRWLSYLPDLPAEMAEPRLQMDIRQEGAQMIYNLTFPWAILGLAVPPPVGTKIGFAVVVNDSDQAVTVRKALAYYSGVADKKDPKAFGAIWIR